MRAKIMALHAATVDILVAKAKFEPTVALGVAEAIELARTQAQFVTVPILDARLHEVRAEIRVLEGKLDASVLALRADMQRLGVDLEAKMDARFAQMDAKMDVRLAQMDGRFAQMDVRLAQMEAKWDAKLAQTEARLVRWVFLVMLGNVALSLAANTVLNALRSL